MDVFSMMTRTGSLEKCRRCVDFEFLFHESNQDIGGDGLVRERSAYARRVHRQLGAGDEERARFVKREKPFVVDVSAIHPVDAASGFEIVQSGTNADCTSSIFRITSLGRFFRTP